MPRLISRKNLLAVAGAMAFTWANFSALYAYAGQYSHTTGMSATVSLTPSAVLAVTCGETATSPTALANAQAGAPCVVGAPTGFIANVSLPTCRVSATGTIQVRVCNVTALSVTPTSGTYAIRVFNP